MHVTHSMQQYRRQQAQLRGNVTHNSLASLLEVSRRADSLYRFSGV
jgi:hypothetical protein